MRKLTLRFTARGDGRVCKRIDGRLRIWPNEEFARREVLALIAIREASSHAAIASVAPASVAQGTVKGIFNAFLLDREARMNSGRIEKGTFLDYKDALDSFIEGLESWHPHKPDAVSLLKRESPSAILLPEHFRHVRAFQGQRAGAYMLERRVQGVRTAFRWAAETARIIPGVPHYGDDYHKPTAADKRADKRRPEGSGEPRFTSGELRVLLKAKIKPSIKAMIWLGLNGGMYSADCAVLRLGDFKREGRATVLDTYREKTGIRQKFVLWPETVKAIEAWKLVRPKPKGNTPADLLFITIHGNAWTSESITRDEHERIVGGGETDSIKLLFNRLLEKLKIKRPGVGFGKFRHTHTSASSRHPDVNARKVVRGHKIGGIEEHYDYQDLACLKSVTDLVYKTLVVPALSSKSGAKRPQKPRHARPGTVRRKRRAA